MGNMENDEQQPSASSGDSNEQQGGWARFPWAARIGSGRVLLITAALCVCGIVAGVLITVLSSPAGSAAGHGGSAAGSTAAGSTAAGSTAAGSTAAGSSSAPATVPATRPATGASPSATGPQVTADGIAKSALRWPAGLNQQMASWKKGPGGAASSAVTTQLATAMQAAGLKLYVQAQQACQSLQASIKTAQGAPSIPDAAMQQAYAKALAGLSSAAVDCQKAISSHPDGDETVQTAVNQSLMSRALTGFDTGSKELYTATAQIRALRG